MLKISRPTLDAYLTMQGSPVPDESRTYDVEAVAEFISQQAKTAAVDASAKNYRMEKTRMEAENLAFDLQVKRGEFFRKSVAIPVFAAMTADLVANLREKFEAELPPRYVGKSQIENAQMNQVAVDLIIARFIAGQKLPTG
jgi:hypothetical protein